MAPRSADLERRGRRAPRSRRPDSSRPRASASARALMRLRRSTLRCTPSSTPSRGGARAAPAGRARVPVPHAQREPLHGAHALVGEDRPRHRRRAARDEHAPAAARASRRCRAGDVDGARQLAVQQRVAHRRAGVHRDVALRLGGRRADVRREHDVRRAAQRMVGGQRLLGERVEHRAAQRGRSPAPRAAPPRRRCRRARGSRRSRRSCSRASSRRPIMPVASRR